MNDSAYFIPSKEFDFVMIAEHMDESLIFLQDILCWPLVDLTYLKQNVRKQNSKSNMTQETRWMLNQVLRCVFEVKPKELKPKELKPL